MEYIEIGLHITCITNTDTHYHGLLPDTNMRELVYDGGSRQTLLLTPCAPTHKFAIQQNTK